MFKLHVIAGLPRSGSTLLAALLNQNPAFKAGMTSPVYGLVDHLIPLMSGDAESAAAFHEEQREAILRGVFQGFYSQSIGKIIFETNRKWTSRLPLLHTLFPKSKVICCIRDVGWIADSLERSIIKSPYHASRFMYGPNRRGMTQYSRMDSYLDFNHGVIGQPWAGLREAFFGEFSDKLVLIPYEKLATAPLHILDQLYDILEEEAFPHDIRNINYSADAYDNSIGIPHLHKIDGPIALEARETILPPDLFEACAPLNFWDCTTDANPRHVLIL